MPFLHASLNAVTCAVTQLFTRKESPWNNSNPSGSKKPLLLAGLTATALLTTLSIYNKKIRNKTSYRSTLHSVHSHSDFPAQSLLASTTSSLSSPRLRNITLSSLFLTSLFRALGILPTKFRTGKNNFLTTTMFFYVSSWMIYYRFYVIESPHLNYVRTFYNVQICLRSRLSRKFYPFPFLTSTHSQTVLCTVLADSMWMLLRPLNWREESFKSWDGNTFTLDYYTPPSPTPKPPSTPILLLLYGIGGTRNDHYIKRLTLASESRGWRTVVFSYWRLDWMETRDLANALKRIKEKYPDAPISCVACSAGAHVLVPYLSKCGDSSPFVCCVSISGCLDFERTYKFVSATQNGSYRLMLNRCMRRCVSRHHERDINSTLTEEEKVGLESIKRADVMYDRHLGRCEGFMVDGEWMKKPKGLTEEEWWGAVTDIKNCVYPTPSHEPHYDNPARNMVKNIQTTLLMIHSRDDTMVSFNDAVDWEEVERNQHIISLQTNRGGHIGFHEWLGFLTGTSWAEAAALDFVSAVLETNAQTGFLLDVMERSKKSPKYRDQSIAELKPEVLAGFSSASGVSSSHLERDSSAENFMDAWQTAPHLGDSPQRRRSLSGGGGGIFF
ncbi:hypothetical protein TrST_g1679 [Triparma strigata]|uniref:Uncharacterized protein n=1 Tax=Triparma strigata TaxID=1606541 RepID=A0A9W7BI68_9STRA|nr:hypothetical protein TrST_g1679 [Triparma strigata]